MTQTIPTQDPTPTQKHMQEVAHLKIAYADVSLTNIALQKQLVLANEALKTMSADLEILKSVKK